MAHPQSSPRSFVARNRVDIGAQQMTDGTTYLNLNNGIRISGVAGGLLTATATDLALPGGITISGARTIRANSTGITAVTVESAIPATRSALPILVPISNSTGRSWAINTTATTNLYLQVTSIQPTTLA